MAMLNNQRVNRGELEPINIRSGYGSTLGYQWRDDMCNVYPLVN